MKWVSAIIFLILDSFFASLSSIKQLFWSYHRFIRSHPTDLSLTIDLESLLILLPCSLRSQLLVYYFQFIATLCSWIDGIDPRFNFYCFQTRFMLLDSFRCLLSFALDLQTSKFIIYLSHKILMSFRRCYCHNILHSFYQG